MIGGWLLITYGLGLWRFSSLVGIEVPTERLDPNADPYGSLEQLGAKSTCPQSSKGYPQFIETPVSLWYTNHKLTAKIGLLIIEGIR